jgi:hypothetical protein
MTIRSTRDQTITQDVTADFEALLDASSLGSARVVAESEALSGDALARLHRYTAGLSPVAPGPAGGASGSARAVTVPLPGRASELASLLSTLRTRVETQSRETTEVARSEGDELARNLSIVTGDAPDAITLQLLYLKTVLAGIPLNASQSPFRPASGWDRMPPSLYSGVRGGSPLFPPRARIPLDSARPIAARIIAGGPAFIWRHQESPKECTSFRAMLKYLLFEQPRHSDNITCRSHLAGVHYVVLRALDLDDPLSSWDHLARGTSPLLDCHAERSAVASFDRLPKDSPKCIKDGTLNRRLRLLLRILRNCAGQTAIPSLLAAGSETVPLYLMKRAMPYCGYAIAGIQDLLQADSAIRGGDHGVSVAHPLTSPAVSLLRLARRAGTSHTQHWQYSFAPLLRRTGEEEPVELLTMLRGRPLQGPRAYLPQREESYFYLWMCSYAQGRQLIEELSRRRLLAPTIERDRNGEAAGVMERIAAKYGPPVSLDSHLSQDGGRATLWADITVRLVTCMNPLEAAVVVPTRITYRSHDPYAVELCFERSGAQDNDVKWILGRDLFADGLGYRRVGAGDVRIWSRSSPRPGTRGNTFLQLSAPEGCALMVLDRGEVRQFLHKSDAIVTPGMQRQYTDAALQEIETGLSRSHG